MTTGTLSSAACSSLERMFTRAATAHLRLDAEHSVTVTPLRDGAVGNLAHQRVVVFTIASFRFRLVVLFHVPDDPAVKAYFNPQEAGKPTAIESISELGNLCCGAINRDLIPSFPCLAMSSPYLLDGPCAGFIDDLRPQQVSRFTVLVHGTAQLHATLCICAYADVDFNTSFEGVADTCGELEMF